MFQYLFEKDWYYTDWGVLDRTHLVLFTYKSLKRALTQHGFKILRLEGINTDFRVPGSGRALGYLIAARALALLSFGYYADIRHPQFAFQATPRQSARD